MTRIIFRLAVIALGITAASYMIPGIESSGPWPVVKAAVFLGILNISIKPVLILLTLPITLITLGLFTLVINGLMLWMVGGVIDGFTVTGFLPATLGAVIISIISIFFNQALAD